MMKMTGKAFAKKLFGAKYERLPRTLLMDVIVFLGLYIAGFQVQIASFVRVLMINAGSLFSPMWGCWATIRFLQRQGCFSRSCWPFLPGSR